MAAVVIQAGDKAKRIVASPTLSISPASLREGILTESIDSVLGRPSDMVAIFAATIPR
jgi:hypothetical protein